MFAALCVFSADARVKDIKRKEEAKKIFRETRQEKGKKVFGVYMNDEDKKARTNFKSLEETLDERAEMIDVPKG